MRISDWSSDVCSSDLTDEQLLRFAREQYRNRGEDQADRDRRATVDAGVAGGVAQPDAGGGDDQHGERGAVFEQNDESGGVLRAPDRLPPDEPATPRDEFAPDHAPGGALEQERHRHTKIDDRGVSQR